LELPALMMQTATFAKHRLNAESIRGIHPEAIPIDNNILLFEALNLYFI